MDYHNEDWLREQIEVKHRTFLEIGKEFGCTRENIKYFAKKFGIKSNNPKHARKGRFLGEKSPLWRGGTHRYSYGWTFISEELRRISNYTCSQCGIQPEDTNYICVHHIDENPKNNRLDNLLVVCQSCHRKIHARGGLSK